MVAMLSYVIRVYGYTLLTPETVWYVYLADVNMMASIPILDIYYFIGCHLVDCRRFVLLLELLHGITFALMWTAGVKFMTMIAPEEWLTTAQSIFSAVYFCVGYGK